MAAWLRDGEQIASPAADAWGLTAEERAETLGRLRKGPVPLPHAPAKSGATEPADLAAFIGHGVMVSGLLAASRIRPAAVTAAVPPDPWYAGVAALQIMPRLEDFAPDRWVRICLDCVELLDGWCNKMRQLGWSTEDAFGIDPAAPGAAVHHYGLGLLLNAGRVIEMTEKGARIETRRGVSQSFTRKSDAWAVPIWTVKASEG